jgi:hypothetical protein
MFPYVPAGAVLSLRPRSARPIAIGHIVCYPAGTGDLVAHRVVARVSDPSPGGREPVWLVRGDAGGLEEQVAESGIAWVVDEVAHRGVRYRTDGALGRLLARIAVDRGALHRACTHVGRAAVGLAHSVRARGADRR